MPEIFDGSTQPQGTEAEEQLFHSGVAEGTQAPEKRAKKSKTSDHPSEAAVRNLRGRKGRMKARAARSDSTSQPHRHVDEYSETMRAEACTTNPLSSFIAKPPQMRFVSQEINESIVLVLRQAPITQLRWILLASVLLTLPLFTGGLGVFSDIPGKFKLAALLGWYLLLFGFVLEQFLKWFYNVYIITDERIIDVDFHSLIYKSISAAKIDNIEDTTARTGGFLASLFNYGTVVIQTAADKREFEFDNVPQPNKVTQVINELIIEEEREKFEGRTH